MSLLRLVSTAKTMAASTGVNPYVVTRESWFAGSSWSRRSMLGTAASLAGIQNRLIVSMRNWATNSQIRLSTSGIEANSENRIRSVTTIVLRRSNRSAKAPASGPSTIAGSRRNSRTAPSAKFWPAKLSTSEVAVAVIASRPSQSPKLDSDIDSHSLRKSRTCRTARIFAPSPTEPGTSSPRIPSGSAVGAAASGGTGVCAGGSPSPTDGTPDAAPSTEPRSPWSSGGGAGGVGSDGIGAPGVSREGWWRLCGGLTVPGGGDDPRPFRTVR